MAVQETPTDFDALWDYDKPVETEMKFRELLPAAQASSDKSYHAQLLTQIARAAGLQRKFDEAHELLNEAEKLLTGDLERARIRILLERGRVFNSSGNPEQAQPYFQQAWERALAAGEDFYAVDAAHMLAIVEPPEQQLDWNLRAIEMAEKSADPRARKWLASLYNNLGWTYHDSQKYETALDTFQKALKYREEQGDVETTRVARWCVGRALRSLNRIQEAHAIHTTLLGEYEEAGEKSGYVYEELAECLLALKRTDEAQPYFALAYEELSKDSWLVENEPARLQHLKELGKVK
jgi:tetratricopeptide (TPR) repeat protein